MRKLTLVLMAVATISLVAGSAYAFVIGPTNFGFGGYPDPSCTQPYVPYSSDKYAWQSFQYDLEKYKSCIQEYLEAAENDKKRISEKANEAIDNFNRFVRSIK